MLFLCLSLCKWIVQAQQLSSPTPTRVRPTPFAPPALPAATRPGTGGPLLRPLHLPLTPLEPLHSYMVWGQQHLPPTCCITP